MHPTHTVLAGLGERVGGVLYQRYLGSIIGKDAQELLALTACVYMMSSNGKAEGGRRDDSRDASSRERQTGGDFVMNQQA
jgi:hypothetical protein